MADSGDGTRLPHRIEKSPTEARQAIKPGVVRYVLAISLAVAVIAMIVAYVATGH